MIIEEVIEFLKKTPPFQFLDEASLRIISSGISMEFYPKGTTILYQDGPASDYLRIIKKGGVKVFVTSNGNGDVLIDYRSEGDAFGFLSLISGDKSRANVAAVEDTIAYLIGREAIMKLLDVNPAFTEFFVKSFLNKYIDKTYKEMHNKSLLYGGGDKLLFTTPVGELATKDIITASQDISIKDAAGIMSKNGISSLVLVDGDKIPTGIVTDRDLRDKVVAKDRNIADPVSGIMSLTLIKAEARDYCFEALLKMIHFNIHHLLVVDEGRLKGIVTNHDLMMLQGTSPLSVARDIESQQAIDGLIPVSKKISNVISLLLKEGARASNITRIITEINDRLVRKILDIAEREFGRPPVNYCWVVFGSEGRKEQTFKTDQDNALIYADADGEKEEEAEKYFSAFTAFVRDSLLKCGFPLCPANYMASNREWRQPLRIWKKYFSRWIAAPTPDAILKSLIFFDLRPIYGDLSLAEELRKSLKTMLEDQMLFLGYMANTITKNTPPVGFFKSFIVEKSGEHKDELNLKIKGIAPLADIIRLFSLEKGVTETSTLERNNALKGKYTIIEEYAEELEQAFEFIMLLRIQHQVEQIEAGIEPDNFINPDKLSNLEKKTIKEAFKLISRMQDLVIARYKQMIW
ncbi:MAG: cyclic nucleotide-binding/CBS domain-containing protein [Nitrospirae bacterium]|nr:MAG: cyclic nucleotide-binding/CBS domain-containing protein [Nitrospirota bacterium]